MDVSGKYVACFFMVEDTLYGEKNFSFLVGFKGDKKLGIGNRKEGILACLVSGNGF